MNNFPAPPLIPTPTCPPPNMEFEPTHLIRILACFAIGAIPFAKVAMWGTGIDITKVGSKKPGFNNVLRVSTKPRAAVALVGDSSQGVVVGMLRCGDVPGCGGTAVA